MKKEKKMDLYNNEGFVTGQTVHASGTHCGAYSEGKTFCSTPQSLFINIEICKFLKKYHKEEALVDKYLQNTNIFSIFEKNKILKNNEKIRTAHREGNLKIFKIKNDDTIDEKQKSHLIRLIDKELKKLPKRETIPEDDYGLTKKGKLVYKRMFEDGIEPFYIKANR